MPIDFPVTVKQIVEHVVVGTPYVRCDAKKDSEAYRTLKSQTTDEIISEVRDFVLGKLRFEDLDSKITGENTLKYLAACKIIDIEQGDVTYIVRDLCRQRMGASEPARNILCAFMVPPDDAKDYFRTNELSPRIKVPDGIDESERARLARENFKYATEEVRIVPAVALIIEETVRERFDAIKKANELMPGNSLVAFRGCSGGGKTFAVQQYLSKNMGGISPKDVIHSTDFSMESLRKVSGDQYSRDEVYMCGVCIFRSLDEIMASRYPKYSKIVEGWLDNERLIKDLVDGAMCRESVAVNDFDGDFEAIALRVLSRRNNPDCTNLLLETVVSAYKRGRSSRVALLKELERVPHHVYSLTYANKDGTVTTVKDPRSITSSDQDAEIQNVSSLVITDEHVKLFGESLRDVVGKTVAEAYNEPHNRK